jgi:hypothetical protein
MRTPRLITQWSGQPPAQALCACLAPYHRWTGLDLPSAGRITVAGDEMARMSDRKLPAWRASYVGGLAA